MRMRKNLKNLLGISCLLLAVLLFGCKKAEPESVERTPVEVVAAFLEAERDNNLEVWLETLHPSIRDRNWIISGAEGLSVNELWELSGEEAIEEKARILKGDNAKNLGLEEQNLSIVYAKFSLQENSAFTDDEPVEWYFILIRAGRESPWYIVNFGQGRGGIPNLQNE